MSKNSRVTARIFLGGNVLAVRGKDMNVGKDVGIKVQPEAILLYQRKI